MSNSDQRVNIGFALCVLASVVVVVMGYGWFFSSYQNHFYPGVTVMGVDVSGLSLIEAQTKVEQALPPLGSASITLSGAKTTLASDSGQLGLSYKIDSALAQAWKLGRQGTPLQRAWEVTQLAWQPQNIPVRTTFNAVAVNNFVESFSQQDDVPGKPAVITLGKSGAASTLSADRGQTGHQVQRADTAALIFELSDTDSASIAAVITPTFTELTDQQVDESLKRATGLVGHKLIWHDHDITLELNDQQLLSLLNWPAGIQHEKINELITDWEKKIARPPQDAQFVYDPNTLAVSTFVPDKPGLNLDRAVTAQQLTEWLSQFDQPQPVTDAALHEPTNFTLQMATTAPTISLASTNDLGINERIGIGDSEYAHSIPSRIHNVALAASRINNYLIKPGAEFSFNKALGDVSGATGYQPAYVIKSGQTVLGDGGGVCQVSTTLFRAVLNAGLDVTKRKAHSYRVSYYELDQKPGIDATVYSGDVDLRFINDTGHHILIRTETDSKNLEMKIELFGTSDGRVAEITDHKTWDARPAPPAQYIVDPTLPPGKTKQIDWAASGIKASFKHTVRDKNGNIIHEDTYVSNYIPWAAKYLRGP